MALIMSYESPHRARFAAAYVRISAVEINQELRRAVIWVTIWADKDAADAAKRGEPVIPLWKGSVTVEDTPDSPDYTNTFAPAALDAAGVNPIAQGYIHLKTLRTYSRASNA